MKYFLSLLLFFHLTLFAESNQTKEELISNEPLEVKDTSGLTTQQVRKIASESDKRDSLISIKNIFEVTDEQGKVDISQIQSSWRELSPEPTKCDWVQTKWGEWFCGKIKSMYDGKMEFDSKEVDLQTFNDYDILQIKSFRTFEVNIEGVATFSGILRYNYDEITIIQGDKSFTFPYSQVISIAPTGDNRINKWSGKISISVDVERGNKDKYDLTAQVTLNRREGDTRLRLDYLGSVSSANDVETANDHRLNEKFDIYLSRKFFWTPLFSEYYQNPFQNIDKQYTAGVGIGYTLLHSKMLQWDVSGGPALIQINYVDVEEGKDKFQNSGSLELRSINMYKINTKVELNYDYKINVASKKAGGYKHHMVAGIETDFLIWLDFDVTLVWDFAQLPETDAYGHTPLQSDLQFLVGFGIDF